MFVPGLTLCLASFMFDATPNKTQWEGVCKNIDHIMMSSKAYNVKPSTLIVLMWHESRWKSHKVSPIGACGMAQVLPKYTRPRVTCRQLKNPEVGILYGAKSLRYWIDWSKSDNLTKALCHYNGGNNCYKRSLAYARAIRSSLKKFNRHVNVIDRYIKKVFFRTYASKLR